MWPLRDDTGWGGVEAGMFSLIEAPALTNVVCPGQMPELCVVSGSAAASALKNVHVKLKEHECVAFDSSCSDATVQGTTFTGEISKLPCCFAPQSSCFRLCCILKVKFQ